MYTLYGTKGSGSAAVEVALEMCALPHRTVRASTWEDDSARDELRSVNPMQQIPTLVLPDQTVMSESAAILIHLGIDVAAPGQLLPVNPSRRAQSIRGLVFIAANCYSAISIGDYPQRWTTSTDKEQLEAIKLGTRGQLHRHWDIFADTFNAEPFMNGEAPGALDILAAVVSKWSGARAHLKEHRPSFFALLQRIDTHESVAPVFEKHWAPA